MAVKIKYPTKKEIQKIVDAYRDKLINEFSGHKMNINVEDAEYDYKKGIETAIKEIKRLNK